VNDNDCENETQSVRLLADKKYIFDITHNPFPDYTSTLEKNAQVILTNNFQFWYNPEPKRVFFPLFLWMDSNRTPLWHHHTVFDAGSNKTKSIMCLNHIERTHRTWLWNEFDRKSIIDKMVYTFRGHRTLPNESSTSLCLTGIEHPVYSECAVNIVTETSVDLMYISEKTCKPFMANQIPVIVGSAEVNKFLQDVGLDMFEDIVPWRTWDSTTDLTERLQMIADFVEQWINSGTILSDYQRVLPRVERNKQYFHSEEFRNRIMNQMSNLHPA
jgi:hypothetical protein